VHATGTHGASGIDASSDNGIAITAQSNTNIGIYAVTAGGPTFSPPPKPIAILAQGWSRPAILATSDSSVAIEGDSTSGTGIIGKSSTGIGIHAVGGGASLGSPPFPQVAIFAEGGPNAGIFSQSSNVAIYGVSAGVDVTSAGVHGQCSGAKGQGVFGFSDSGTGVLGLSDSGGTGVHAVGDGFGVYSTGETAVQGVGGHIGVTALNSTNTNAAYLASDCCAAWFTGNVVVTGTLNHSSSRVQIDNPCDPANKYLSHSSVGSAEMKNMYDGIVMLDANGEAIVRLPEWFETFNTDFRYQLTPVGAPGSNLHIVEEISNNYL